MYRIIGGDGREYGPVTAAQIAQWIAQNRANGLTRVKAEGATTWLPLAETPEFAALFAPSPIPPPAAAAEPAEPGALPPQKLAPPPAPPEAAHEAADRAWTLGVCETLSQGWAIVSRRPGLVVGATLVATLVNALAGSLPIVGLVATILFTQVFYAGIYWLMLRVARGDPAEFADVFAGFSRSFGQLVLLSLATFFGIASLALVAAGPLLWALHQSGVFAGAEPDFPTLAGPLLALPILALPLVYFSVSWIFAPLLVIDRGLGFWAAMETSRRVVGKRWFHVFLLYLAFLPLMIAGLLCCLVGIFVVSALLYATFATAYEAAFAELPAQDSGEPTA